MHAPCGELFIVKVVTLRYQGGQQEVHIPGGALDIIMIVTVLPHGRQRGVHIPGGELDIFMLCLCCRMLDSGECMSLVGSFLSSKL